MINKQRVMRFRALIQFVIFLLVAVPIVLIIILCFRMVGMLGEITVYLERASGMSFVDSAEPTEASSVAPENQSLTNHPSGEKQSPLPREVSREESGGQSQSPTAAAPVETAGGSTEAPAREAPESSSPDTPNPPEGGSAFPVPVAGPGSAAPGNFSGAGANPVTGA